MAYEYQIYEARITFANPVDQVYRAWVGETGLIFDCIPIGIRRATHGAVIVTESYSEGDIVFVLKNSTATNAGPGQIRGFILGLCPGDGDTLVDATTQGTPAEDKEGLKLYKETSRALDFPAGENTTFTNRHRGDVAAGDFTIGGTETQLHMSERTVSIGSDDATIKTNSIDGSITTESIVYENKTPGVHESVKIINDTVLKTTRVYDCLNGAIQPDAGFVEQTGGLAYGNIRTIKGATGEPISQIAQLHDGQIKLDAATGIRMVRTTNIPAQTDYYGNLINYDDKVKSTPTEHPEPFDRVTDSDNWVGSSRTVDESEKLPVQRPLPDATKKVLIRATAGNGEKYTVPSESGVYVLDDGSIVIRDAWGSEIRMVNGDIQLSAANKIINIADTDMLNYCGGVAATKAGAGFQVKTDFGHIDMASAKEVNIIAAENISVVGDKDISLLSLEDIVVDSGKDLLVRAAGTALMSVTLDVFVEANTYCVAVNSDATLATANALLRVTPNGTDIVGARTNIHSDVEISDKTYDAGKTLNGALSPMGGSGGLRIGSTLTVDSGIIAKEYIMSKSALYAGQVCATTVAEDVGVFKIKSLPKVTTDVSDHKSESRYLKAQAENAVKKLSEATPEDILKNAFTAKFKDPTRSSDDLVIYRPSYVESGASRDSMPGGEHHIAAAGKSVYIYPGADYWKAESVIFPTKADTIGTGSKKQKLSALTTIVKEANYYEQGTE